MLINFVGSPASGKTTTAAMLFAKMKEYGFPAEFISEEARRHIAMLKFHRKLFQEKPTLNDIDQIIIMENQVDIERMMIEGTSPDTIVISDGSPLNALLYMSSEFRREDVRVQYQLALTRELMHKSLTFVCEPLKSHRDVKDSNRIHDLEQILKIDEQLISVMNEAEVGPLGPPGEHSGSRWIWLGGDPQQRLVTALCSVYYQMRDPDGRTQDS